MRLSENEKPSIIGALTEIEFIIENALMEEYSMEEADMRSVVRKIERELLTIKRAMERGW